MFIKVRLVKMSPQRLYYKSVIIKALWLCSKLWLVWNESPDVPGQNISLDMFTTIQYIPSLRNFTSSCDFHSTSLCLQILKAPCNRCYQIDKQRRPWRLRACPPALWV